MTIESGVKLNLSEAERLRLEDELRLGFKDIPVESLTVGQLAIVLTLFNRDLTSVNKKHADRDQDLKRLGELLITIQEKPKTSID